MKHLINLLVAFEIVLLLLSLGYAIHGIFWLSIVSIVRSICCYAVANHILPATIRTLLKI